jgi:hypothetical protein
MLSQLQKQFQQVTSKIFSPPTAAAKTAGVVTNNTKTAKTNFKAAGPAIPMAPSKKMETTQEQEVGNDHQQQQLEKEQQQMSKEELVASQRKARTKAQATRMRSIQSAISKERAVREAQEPFDFWTNVKQFNWKALVAFMVCWTVLGYYVIPTIKGWKGWTPPTIEEKNKEYNEGKQKLVGDTYRLRQRIEARKLRAERLESLETSTAITQTSTGTSEK